MVFTPIFLGIVAIYLLHKFESASNLSIADFSTFLQDLQPLLLPGTLYVFTIVKRVF